MLNGTVEHNLKNAEKFIKKDDIENASKIYNDILTKFPKNLRAIHSLNKLKEINLEKKIDIINNFYSNGKLIEAEIEGDKLLIEGKNNIKLLRILGTIKAELGKLKEAENIFYELLKIEKLPYMTLANLGSINYLLKNFDKASSYFKKSLEIKPENQNALNGVGLLYMQKKNYREAIRYFENIIKVNSSAYNAYLNIGNCYKELSELETALENYNKALDIKSFPEVYNNIGSIFSEKKDSLTAIKYFTQALELNNQYFEAFNNRGIEFYKIKNYHDAINDFENSFAINSNFADAYINLANIYFEEKKFDEAKVNYVKGLKINPSFYESYNNLGVCYSELKKYEEAIDCFDKSINLKLDYAGAYNNKGYALFSLYQFEEALKCFDIASSLNNTDPDIPLNIGNLKLVQSNHSEAIKYYEKAIMLQPDFIEPLFNLSLVKLLHSDFKNGLPLYESRLSQKKRDKIFNFEIKNKWDGVSSLENKKVVVLSEQGLGDTIQFCRFIKKLPLKKSNVIFSVQDCLVDLISTLDNNIKVVGKGVDIGMCDWQIPLLSLPYMLNTTYSSIPSEEQYLHAKKHLIKKWKNKIGSKGFKVGIAWKGSNSDADRYRSFSVKEFEILSSLKDIRFISLQKNDGVEQLKDNLKINIEDYSHEIDTGDQAFTDTSAIIDNLDLVITCCTSIAHLSGALNCPTWIVLAKSHDWRWFVDNKNSVWYPSVTLFRQEQLGNWDAPFQSIKQKLIKDYKIK